LQIIIAKIAGFCSGVNRAVNCLLEEAKKSGEGSTLGPIVHNEEVVEYLQQNHISAVNNAEEVRGSYLAIRTHGVAPKVFNDISKREDLRVIDLTCPRVKKVQEIAADSAGKGLAVIIFGNRAHPEVEGLLGWAGDDAVVISSLEELKELKVNTPSVLIAQTTGNPNIYREIQKEYKKKDPKGQIYDTLCPETELRQKEVIELAQRVEALLVVGSESSANTKTLYDSCRQLKPSCRVTSAEELDLGFIRQHRVIGVTAGASTPPWTIKEVVERMENESMEEKNEVTEKEETQIEREEQLEAEQEKTDEVETVQEEGPNVNEEQDQAADEVEGQGETENQAELDFAVDVKVAREGEQVTGKVARVTDEEVFVDIGSKTEAILPVNEVHLNQGQTLADIFAPEDDLEVTVLDVDDQEGKVVVSHKRLAREKRLKELEEALEKETILEGKVKQVVSAGIVVDLGSGVEGFMPGSLVDTRYIQDFNEFKDLEVRFKVQEYDREKGKLILNRRKVMEEESSRKREETLNSLEIGSNITGTVKRLTDFGAFVDVGGIDGLVHISELSWERVKHPKEVLKVGDEIEVKVLEVIPEKERISLSIRKTQPDPWIKATADLESEQLISGTVTRLVNFGAFVEIKPGVEGLAHISQLADYHVKHPSEVLSEGQEVEVKILEVKPKAKRISLSIKDSNGVMVASQNTAVDDAENGNVTLGDVFGSLFDSEEFREEQTADLEEQSDNHEEGNEQEPEGGRG